MHMCQREKCFGGKNTEMKAWDDTHLNSNAAMNDSSLFFLSSYTFK